MILHAENPTVRDFCNRLHKDIARQFQYAWVWGSSVKYQPQRVGLDHKLCDEDVVQIVKRECNVCWKCIWNARSGTAVFVAYYPFAECDF